MEYVRPEPLEYLLDSSVTERQISEPAAKKTKGEISIIADSCRGKKKRITVNGNIHWGHNDVGKSLSLRCRHP